MGLHSLIYRGLRTFNDYPFGEYGQAAGSGRHPTVDDDIVCTCMVTYRCVNDAGKGLANLIEHIRTRKST